MVFLSGEKALLFVIHCLTGIIISEANLLRCQLLWVHDSQVVGLAASPDLR